MRHNAGNIANANENPYTCFRRQQVQVTIRAAARTPARPSHTSSRSLPPIYLPSQAHERAASYCIISYILDPKVDGPLPHRRHSRRPARPSTVNQEEKRKTFFRPRESTRPTRFYKALQSPPAYTPAHWVPHVTIATAGEVSHLLLSPRNPPTPTGLSRPSPTGPTCWPSPPAPPGPAPTSTDPRPRPPRGPRGRC